MRPGTYHCNTYRSYRLLEERSRNSVKRTVYKKPYVGNAHQDTRCRDKSIICPDRNPSYRKQPWFEL
jgi:hypothetical protein